MSFIGMLVFTLAAYFSVGYYAPDEHYQIIEFSHVIMHPEHSKLLPWEYQEQMRSSIQPVLGHSFFWISQAMGIEDPFHLTLTLRLISGLLSIFAISRLIDAFSGMIPQNNKLLFTSASYFLWFIPFLSVRFSSECWAGIFIILAITSSIKENLSRVDYFIIGILLGFSFLFRFQIAFAAIGLILWLILIRNTKLRYLLLLFAGILFSVSIGFFSDRFFYGEWVITPWNYFVQNILENKASQFGESPFLHYFQLIFRDSFYPFGIIILSAFVTLIIKEPKNILVWIILPFILGHSLISHKEIRFMFPLILLIPSMIFIASSHWKISVSTLLKRTLISMMITINLIALIVASFTPAGNGRVALYKSLADITRDHEIILYHLPEDDPYSPWGLYTTFYNNPKLSKKKLKLDAFTKFEIPTGSYVALTISETKNNNTKLFIEKNNLQVIFKSVPSWSYPFIEIYGGTRDQYYLLYTKP